MNELICPQCGHENNLFTKYLGITRNCARCGCDLENIPDYADRRWKARGELGAAMGILAVIAMFFGGLLVTGHYFELLIVLLFLFIASWVRKWQA